MSFANIPFRTEKQLNPDINFWELNPQFKYYKPYNKLYTRDKSERQIDSSKEMWTIVFLTHPDDEVNIFYRKDYEERLDILKETFCPHFDTEDAVIIECIDRFPDDTLTSIQKSLKIELDTIRKRANYLDKTEITKETASIWNKMQADASRVYDGYEKVKEKFLAEKAEIRAKGNRRRSKAEKGQMWNYAGK